MTFPLAGLLRVRGAQERVAAERLSRASAERAQAETAEQNAVSSLADISAQIDDPRALMAMAAARAAGRSTLSDLQALVDMRRDAETEAKSAHVDARLPGTPGGSTLCRGTPCPQSCPVPLEGGG